MNPEFICSLFLTFFLLLNAYPQQSDQTHFRGSRFDGKFKAFPVYAGGYIFFPSATGETLVIKEVKELNTVSSNTLPGEIYATPKTDA